MASCPHCGREFRPSKKGRKYCSLECYNNARKIAVAAKRKICPECGQEFWPRWNKLIYCSRKCANEARRRALSKQVTRTCENCGRAYTVKPSKANVSRFCSARCRSRWVATHMPRKRKPYIIDSSGYRLVWVGDRYRPEHIVVWERAHGPIPPGYVVHHKNLNRQDNRLENLQLMTRAEHIALHNRISHPNLLERKKELYVTKLKNLADLLGRPPTKRELDAICGLPPSGTFRRLFGSWSAALRHVGLEPLPPGPRRQEIA